MVYKIPVNIISSAISVCEFSLYTHNAICAYFYGLLGLCKVRNMFNIITIVVNDLESVHAQVMK